VVSTGSEKELIF